MGKKPETQNWPEAIRLCRLNRNDVEMAKSLGLNPDTLIRARPDRKEEWKLPVNEWVRELHRQRFGHVLGEKPLPSPAPIKDYAARNEDEASPKKRKGSQLPSAGAATGNSSRSQS